jgi:oxygen-independent coproporphyrinogen-3 oxidase
MEFPQTFQDWEIFFERFEQEMKGSQSFDKDKMELLQFAADDLLTMNDDFITCSQTGTLLIRNIAMPFDAYMSKHASSTKTFSKTV